MNLPQQASGQQLATPTRRPTVVMGRQDFFSVLLRLVGVELYKFGRRAMSKVMLVIALLSVILLFTVIAVAALYMASAPLPAPAGLSPQKVLESFSSPLRLPQSLTTTVWFLSDYIGLILIIILAGTIVGGEYSVGTIRLIFTRGPSRKQFFLSKLGALLVISAGSIIGLTLIGVIVGAVLNLVTGVSTSFSFFTAEWVMHTALFLLAAIFGLFMYAVLSACLSLLGRSTTAGVAGGIVWWVLEGTLGQVLSLLATYNRGPVGDFLRFVPDYFIGNNVTALLMNQSHYLTGGTASPISDLHALLVLAIYLILFIGLAWWVNEQRDVTN